MRKGRFLFSAIEFMFVVVLFLAGASFFVLHFSQEARQFFGECILEGKASFLFVAILISSVALVLSVCFGAMQQGGYIRFKARGFSIDEALVRSAMVAFWEEELPNEPLPSEVYCSKGKIEIITTELKEDLDELEVRLGFFLAKHLGYERDFFISLSCR